MAWDLEKFGYHVLGSEERLILLKALCEIHFDENPRFKIHFTDEYIKTDNLEALRLQPEGHDIHGNAIWYQQDNFGGFRVYSVEEDDEIGNSWKLLASTLKELDHLLEGLRKKTEVNPKDIALMKRKERKEKKSALEQVNAQSRKGRGRAKKLRRKKKKGASESESDDDDENPCAHCYSNKRPDMVLLCDTCDAAYHTLCLRPPLLNIPEGDWICPYCQQLELINSLQTRHKAISAKNKALERVSKRNVFDDIKLSNIVEGDAGSLRTGRHRSKIDYNFTNYNQMINDAISTEGTYSTSTFYRGSSRRRNVHQRGLNNLDTDSVGSESSDYKCSESGNEKEAKTLSRTKGSDAAGCRRSRRLKRKYADDEDQESSESEEENFVRRSTRRRKPSRKTYIDYESDDTPEEVILKKTAKRIDDSDEYVASGSEEDPEDMLLPRRSRRILIDEDGDEDTPDCVDDETDIDEDLCEDMERNVVSDETEEDEEELVLSPSDENCDDSDSKNVDMLTDDDDDDDNDDDNDSVQIHRNRKKRSNVEEKQGTKRSGKDMRNIMKSMLEEKEKNFVRKIGEQSKVNDGGNSSSGKEDEVPEVHEEKMADEAEKSLEKEEFREEEKDFVEKSNDKKLVASNSLESSVKEVEEDANKFDDSKVEEKTLKSDCSEEMDKKMLNTNMKVNEHVDKELKEDNKETQAKDLVELNLNRTDINKSLKSMKQNENSHQRKEQASNSNFRGYSDSLTRKGTAAMPMKDQNYQELYDRRTGVVPRACDITGTISSFSQNMRPSSSQLSSEETIALSSFSPTLKFAPSQPQFSSQDASPVSHLQHQKEILRPRPFPPEQGRRSYDSFPQGSNGNYSSPHSHYHIPRPVLGNLMEQQSLLPPGMHGFPRIAPPQYPGYPLSEQQPVWRPQRYPLPMQWGYPPYHNMPHQGEASQQIAHMHRPYLELLNPADSLPGSSLRNQSSLHVQDTSKRSRTVASTFDAIKPSPSQSYAAFHNMVIGPTEEGSSKKVKRS